MTLGTLKGAFASLAWSWADVKLFLENSVAVSQDSIHVLASMVVLLAAAALMRRPVSTLGPWLAVLGLACINEVIDHWVARPPVVARHYGESVKDLLLTMALPTLVLLSARLAPGLYRPPRKR